MKRQLSFRNNFLSVEASDMHNVSLVKFSGNVCFTVCKRMFTSYYNLPIFNVYLFVVLSLSLKTLSHFSFYTQRNENRLASLDPLVLQEFEFLKNFVARVVSLRPNVLLVEKTVSRLAQDMLLQHGITLVLNVKPVSKNLADNSLKADITARQTPPSVGHDCLSGLK